MKLNRLFIGLSIAAAASIPAAADNCQIHLMVADAASGEDVPAAVADQLATRLGRAITTNGVTADTGYGQFFVAGKFNHIQSDVLPGPPTQHSLYTTLTLYIGDINTKKTFASTSLDLRGVGTSEQRAYINALSQLNARNANIQNFIEKGKEKIIAYFDANYPQILAKARQAASMRNYDEALYHSTQIPECCRGYNEASKLTIQIYRELIDFDGQKLLQAARAAWNANPNADGAAEAYSYLVQIDPASSAYDGAVKLEKEIAAVIKDDKKFETRDKYRDAVETERRMIEAARAVGVAWGQGQQPTTYNVNWLY